jgi:hypothetical protein
MVQSVEVGSYNLPANVFHDTASVVGKYAVTDLAVGDYILPSKLSDAPAAENAYLYNLDGTKQAMSVTIKSFATGLSGKLQSGDIVSVIVADYMDTGETVTPPELQYVEIISVTASTGYDANTGEANTRTKRNCPPPSPSSSCPSRLVYWRSWNRTRSCTSPSSIAGRRRSAPSLSRRRMR